MPSEVSQLSCSGENSKLTRQTTPINHGSNGESQPESSFRKITDLFFQPYDRFIVIFCGQD
jgi:hypothetical protein